VFSAVKKRFFAPYVMSCVIFINIDSIQFTQFNELLIVVFFSSIINFLTYVFLDVDHASKHV
jgi:hypothetical protein